MTEVVAVLLPVAIGFAISPVPLIELILVLFSRRRVVNTIAFVVALLASTALAVFLGALGGDAAGGDDAGGPSTLTRVIVAASDCCCCSSACRTGGIGRTSPSRRCWRPSTRWDRSRSRPSR